MAIYLQSAHIELNNKELKHETIRALADLVEYTPDVRFGQLIADLVVIARGPTPEAVWDMEDAKLLEAAKGHLEDVEKRQSRVFS